MQTRFFFLIIQYKTKIGTRFALGDTASKYYIWPVTKISANYATPVEITKENISFFCVNKVCQSINNRETMFIPFTLKVLDRVTMVCTSNDKKYTTCFITI